MKKIAMFLGSISLVVGLHAEEEALPSKPQVVAHDALPEGSEAVVVTLEPEELAFAAKLTDHNRKVFSSRLNQSQRAAVLVAVDNGTDPDEAVHRMLVAIEMREPVEEMVR